MAIKLTHSSLLVLTLLLTMTFRIDGRLVAAEDSSKQAEFFEKKVRPLLAKRCYECHDEVTGHDNGGLVLETIEGIVTGGSRGPVIDSSDPESSLLLQAVTFDEDDLQMPPSGKMPAAEIEIITKWLKDGAVLPKYGPQKPAPDARGNVRNVDRRADDFWSFRTLQDVPVPQFEDRAAIHWIRQPVDAFILEGLRQKELNPGEEADRRTLMRRLSFDLIGLPPDPIALQAFLESDDQNAFETLVEELLASPHYGERWARMWLDLARYTDFTPDWQNPTDRGWLYRDWVINAFNTNMRYDRFVKLQLAADQLPDTPPDDFAALGFLGLSPTYWKELRLAPTVIEQIVADEWDERIDAVSRTFLGLTVACARCHDHKFDPVSTQDYYALAGVFASTQLHEQPLLPAEESRGVISARKKLIQLQDQLKSVKEKDSSQAETLAKQIAEFKEANPNVEMPFAHTVKDASVFVVADGPDATKLTYAESQARDLPVFHRGNPANTGEIVPRRYLSIFNPSGSANGFEHGSGRIDLANAMLSRSEGLVARVMVNRIWARHFGRGLVSTESDFGSQGDPPSHPQLLEYLASHFVKQGWDIKWLHRQILLSATWRQSSGFRDIEFHTDPDNRTLWRMNRRRLDFEEWRDAILTATGELDLSIGGPSQQVDDVGNVRRTIYCTVAREELHPVLRMHDFPEASAHSPSRIPTTTPLQQLFVLNSAWMEAKAASLWKRLSEVTHSATEEQRIRKAYLWTFNRSPDPDELAFGLEFLAADADASSDQSRQQWTEYLQALLGLNEVCFVD